MKRGIKMSDYTDSSTVLDLLKLTVQNDYSFNSTLYKIKGLGLTVSLDDIEYYVDYLMTHPSNRNILISKCIVEAKTQGIFYKH